MAGSRYEKTLEEHLETFKTMLGGKLPEKVKQPQVPNPDLARSMTALEATSCGFDREDPTDGHCKIEAEVKAVSSVDRFERAPLLDPPMIGSTSPIKSYRTQNTGGSVPVRIEESCSGGLRYCPLLAVVKFPYRCLNQQHRQAVASAFFDAGKIWNRGWDLYYVWCHESPTVAPVVFVSEPQFLTLVSEINAAFDGLNWSVSASDVHNGLVLDFPHAHKGLAPLPLGTSYNRESHDQLRDSIKNITSSCVEDKVAVAAFRDTIELASCAGKNKQKSKTHKQAGLAIRSQQMAAQLLSARKYVGVSVAANDKGHSPMLDRQINNDVVLIAIDCESYERDHRKITEVGIATLDTRDIDMTHPGKCGVKWRSCIQARHFRILEHKHLINKEFLAGRPDNFDFGQSEDVSIKNIASKLASCFKWPFSTLKDHQGVTSDEQEQRKIVLVGHDISQDVAYCHQLGFSILNRSSIIEVLDTASMFRAYSSEINPRSLASMMLHFDVTAWNLHNAGNDAVYTLWALLAMCVEPFAEARAASRCEEREAA